MSSSASSPEGCGTEDSSIDPRWILGIGAALLGSFLSASGMVMQKIAHEQNDKLEPEKRRKVVAGLLCSPLWICGFLLFAILSIPGDIVALAFAPQSVLAPLSGVTVVLCQIVAPCVLNEQVTRLDALASTLILVGCGLTTLSGDRCSQKYTTDELQSLMAQPAFIVHEVFVLVGFIVGAVLVRHTIPTCVEKEEQYRYLAGVFCVLAGLFAGQSNIFFKTVGEVLEQSFSGDPSGWKGPHVYIFLLLMISTATGQISCMNLALKKWTAVKALPLYNVSLIFFASISGLIYFEEYQNITAIGGVVYPVALLLVMSGVMLLMWKPDPEPTDSEEEDKAEIVQMQVVEQANPLVVAVEDTDLKRVGGLPAEAASVPVVPVTHVGVPLVQWDVEQQMKPAVN